MTKRSYCTTINNSRHDASLVLGGEEKKRKLSDLNKKRVKNPHRPLVAPSRRKYRRVAPAKAPRLEPRAEQYRLCSLEGIVYGLTQTLVCVRSSHCRCLHWLLAILKLLEKAVLPSKYTQNVTALYEQKRASRGLKNVHPNVHGWGFGCKRHL